MTARRQSSASPLPRQALQSAARHQFLCSAELQSLQVGSRRPFRGIGREATATRAPEIQQLEAWTLRPSWPDSLLEGCLN